MNEEVKDLLEKVRAHLDTVRKSENDMVCLFAELGESQTKTDMWDAHGSTSYFLSLARMRLQDAITLLRIQDEEGR